MDVANSPVESMIDPEKIQPEPPRDATDPTGRTPERPDETGSRELGGRGGLEPTRYGDWEKAGRCIDF